MSGGTAPAAGAETKAAAPEKGHKEKGPSAITRGINKITGFFRNRVEAVLSNVKYAVIDKPAQSLSDVAEAAGLKIEHADTVGGKVGALIKGIGSMVAHVMFWPVRLVGKGVVYVANVGQATAKGAVGVTAGVASTVVDMPSALLLGEKGHRDGHSAPRAANTNAESGDEHLAHAA